MLPFLLLGAGWARASFAQEKTERLESASSKLGA